MAPSTETQTIGTGANKTITYTPTWNSNGTLASLGTADSFNTANSQTCTFSYDDLTRLVTDNCGTHWNVPYSYDPFGNVTKGGSLPWPLSGGYDPTTNRYTSAAFTYDPNGRLTNDTFDVLGWDKFGNLSPQGSVNFGYDASDRTYTSSGATTQYEENRDENRGQTGRSPFSSSRKTGDRRGVPHFRPQTNGGWPAFCVSQINPGWPILCRVFAKGGPIPALAPEGSWNHYAAGRIFISSRHRLIFTAPCSRYA